MTKQAIRLIDANDLELYAINTGELYARHKQLARGSATIHAWQNHVRRVLDRYTHEIEPVYAKPATVNHVARALKDYYTRHISELDQ
jgi:hypothetical protein